MHARRSHHRSRRIGAAFAVLAALLTLTLTGAVEAGPVAAPQPSGPPSGAANAELPPFVWRASRGAESYEFQIAADRGFNSSVRGLRDNRFDTSNTRATITTAVPNGTYWWRVRAVTKTGQVSAWSTAPLGAQGVDGCTQAPRAGERRARLLPLAAADAVLGAGAAGGEVPRLAGDGSGSGHADRRQDGRDVGDELRPVADPVGRQGQDVLLGRDPARRTGQPRHAVARRLVRLGVAVRDGDEVDGRPRRAGDVRPAVLVAAGRRSRTLRARGQLLARLRAGLEGLLRHAGDRHVALADEAAPRQHLLLARAGGRRRRQRGRLESLERRPEPLREGLRQGRRARPAEHLELAHARRPQRPGPGGGNADAGRGVGSRPRRVELPRRGRPARRVLRLERAVVRALARLHGGDRLDTAGQPAQLDAAVPGQAPAVTRTRQSWSPAGPIASACGRSRTRTRRTPTSTATSAT